MAERLEFRPCRADDPADVAAIQALLEAAPDCALQVEGRLPRPGDAQEAHSDLPPGMDREAKLFGGSRLGGERVHGQSLGTQALGHAEPLARGRGCTALRPAVIETNLPALRFWRHRGLRELYRKPIPRFTGDAHVLERAL